MNQATRRSAAGPSRLVKEIRTIRTSLLSDALGKGGAMDHDMQCHSANCRMAGPAVTVRVHTADILMVGITLSHCPKGSVLVIDGQGELNTALWGEVTTLAARLNDYYREFGYAALEVLVEVVQCLLGKLSLRDVASNLGDANDPPAAIADR